MASSGASLNLKNRRAGWESVLGGWARPVGNIYPMCTMDNHTDREGNDVDGEEDKNEIVIDDISGDRILRRPDFLTGPG